MELVKSRNGEYTIKYNGRWIYSKYNPKEQVKEFVKSLQLNRGNYNKIIIYGLGLGYHIEEIRKIVGDKCEIIIFEYNEDIVKAYMKLNGKIENGFTLMSGKVRELSEKFISISREVDDVIIYPPSLEILKEQ